MGKSTKPPTGKGAGKDLAHAVALWRHKALGQDLPDWYDRRAWASNGKPDLVSEIASGVSGMGSFNRPHIGAAGFLLESGDFAWFRRHMEAQLSFSMGGWEGIFSPYCGNTTAVANAIALHASKGQDYELAVRYWRTLVAGWALAAVPHRDSIIVLGPGVRMQRQPVATVAGAVLQRLLGLPRRSYGSHGQVSLSDNGGGPLPDAAPHWRDAGEGGLVEEVLAAARIDLFSPQEIDQLRRFIFEGIAAPALFGDLRLWFPQHFARTRDRFVAWGAEWGGDNPLVLTSRDGDRLLCPYPPVRGSDAKKPFFGGGEAVHAGGTRFSVRWHGTPVHGAPRTDYVAELEAFLDPAAATTAVVVDRQGLRQEGASQPPPPPPPGPPPPGPQPEPPPPEPPDPPSDPAADFLGSLRPADRALGQRILDALGARAYAAARVLAKKLPSYAQAAVRRLFAARPAAGAS